MRINYNCLRDVMLAVEAHEYIDNEMNLTELWHSDLLDIPALRYYEPKEITYAAIIAIEAGLIAGKFQASGEEVDYLYIMRLTADGHRFLENIRPDDVWDIVCSFGAQTGTLSIDMINTVAPQVLMRMLSEMQFL
ncbi:MAG: DUF2513 domain-containing protein [Firmicutes bacterium]|nr:DUF2513 domain-containing protein [Bacillota bacterium]